MRNASMILGACVLTVLGASGLGCSAGGDGESEIAEGKPTQDEVAAPRRTAERLDARLPASAARELPASLPLAIDPNNDFYLAKALEPEPADTVHVDVSVTAAE